MYNFSKRNVQFLPFFRGLSAEYSNGIWKAFKRCLINVWKPLFSTCCKHKKICFAVKIIGKTFLFLIYFSYLCIVNQGLFCASFYSCCIHLERRKFAAFVVPLLDCLQLVCSCLWKCERMSLQLCNHYVFVGCKTIYTAVLLVFLRVFQQFASKALVYPVTKFYYLAFPWCEQNIFCSVQQCENVQIIF